jgi:predicted RNA binding protein YcfA (HicA-like mRNA interferase family)
MSKRKKRLQRLRQNPSNVSLEKLRQVLDDYGFEYQHTAGSHYTFSVTIAGIVKVLVVPFRRPIKSIYVKQALALIDRVIAEQEEFEPDEDEADESGNGVDS